ncbi:hypothetical protein JYG23_12375 [Sedimentibacter sp. zth1]|uniref:hypothetical protein n=1 Tax=Sedimentibacter sp. zth1 TaxID=2816908 RepID=UPI001A937AB1|nr:hypothetical protein [Sedimentibacter sp. zth1]QSX05464.1 hypothetical protein JYG23_12375 [Sedimentibacter sp. zth1]
MKCSECKYINVSDGNGSPGRCYCKHPNRPKEVTGTELVICNSERHTNRVLIKTSPRWCPLKK